MTPSESGAGYRLKFLPEALAEWRALDGGIKETLRKLLKKRLVQPHLHGAELRGELHGCYDERDSIVGAQQPLRACGW